MPFRKRENNRSYSRISISRLVKVQLPKAAGDKKLAQVSDLSESGLSMRVMELSGDGLQFSASDTESPAASASLSQIKKGDMISLRLQLDPKRPEISVMGRLVWLKKESGGRLRVGLQFVNISEMDRKLIQVYVSAYQA